MARSLQNLLRSRWAWCAVALGMIAVLIAVPVQSYFAATPEELLRESQRALKAGDYDQAERLAARIPESAPEFAKACLLAGEAATKRKDLRLALEHYARIPEDGSEASITALSWTGDILMHLGRPAEAEQQYRRVLASRPDDVLAHAQLALLLSRYSRRWDSIPHLMRLVRGRFSIDHLLWLGNTQTTLEVPEHVRQADPSDLTDPNALIVLARTALDENRSSDAEKLARQAISIDLNQVEAWAVLGQALVSGPSNEFLSWHHRLPRAAEKHPNVWLARGLWALSRNEYEPAVRCFWEAVSRDPNHRTASHLLGQLLVTHGREEDGAAFLERAAHLEELESVLDMIFRHKDHLGQALSYVRRAAQLTATLGRLWESAAWSQVALTVDPGQHWARQGVRQLELRLSPDFPRIDPQKHPARRVDLSSFPLPSWSSDAAEEPQSPASSTAAARVQFADDAPRVGIDFRYFNGYTPPEEGKRMFALMGGGVAVLDYDGDGWPDLYFTQGCRWPPREERSDHRDRLYCNLSGSRFEDVSEPAGLGDTLYGQGVAAGDFNSDGFSDLYVANAGRNRLYRNNGDGTFSDVTVESGIQGERWTASCLIADLNGDACPDLYDVNYLAPPKAYELVCWKNGQPRPCDPDLFDAEQDQFWLNLQDGRFRDVTEPAGVAVPQGKGLGVVAADVCGTGRLDLFIANDGVANFYFVNETSRPGAPPAFREQALLAGLAFDRDGAPQACMGIAADDADGDGRLDLFVTNYYRESNTLYRQSGERIFVDTTRRAGLRDPGFWLLGFGTQFLDVELDGWPDLVVANGHVNDQRDEGQPYAMQPQFFHNAGHGRFIEIPARSLGPYFQGTWLGRGLALLDWNRDGREDFAVSHLDAPAALLTNWTAARGNFLTLKLRGVAASRDAVGTVVRVRAGGRTRVRQLTAGDGYYASNQRHLVFGLGSSKLAERIVIRWPSGSEQTLHNIPAGREYLVIEDRPRPLRLPPRP